MVRFCAASMPLPDASLTAPAAMWSRGACMEFTAVLSDAPSVNVTEAVPLAVMVPADNVTPPVFWPASLTWNLEATCFEESSGSLNVMVSRPWPVWYAADTKAGFIVSRTVMDWSAAAAMALPAVSVTAPASMSRCGAAMAFTVCLSAVLRLNVR